MYPDQSPHHPGRVIQHYTWRFPNRCRILLEKGIIWKRQRVRFKVTSPSDAIWNSLLFEVFLEEHLQSRSMLKRVGDKWTEILIPEIRKGNSALMFEATSTSLTVYEFFDQPASSAAMQLLPPRIFSLKEILPANPEKPRASLSRIPPGSSWIALYDDLRVLEFDNWFHASYVLLWILKSPFKRSNDDQRLYKYRFYTSGMLPVNPFIGGYICKRVFEATYKVGELYKIQILFEVTDPKGEIRRFPSFDSSPKAFPEFLKTMRNFSVYSDWKEMNAVQREAKAYGITEADLSLTVTAMIRDTGIVR